MTTLDDPAVPSQVNRTAEYFGKPVYFPVPKPSLPESVEERANLWNDCVLETALALRHLIYSPDQATARWALGQLVDLEKTSLRHNRPLTGTQANPDIQPPETNGHPEFEPLPPLPPLFPTRAPTPKPATAAAPKPAPLPNPEPAIDESESAEMAARQMECFQAHVDDAFAAMQERVEQFELPNEQKQALKAFASRRLAGLIVQCNLMKFGKLPSEMETGYFRKQKYGNVIALCVKHRKLPREELFEILFGEYAEEMLAYDDLGVW